MNTCLGDLFSVSWMEDLDAHGSSQSLESQYQTVKKLVSKSSVKQWGDLSFKTDPLSEFFGNIKKTGAAVSPASVRSIRQTHLAGDYHRYLGASPSHARLEAGRALQHTIQDQLAAEIAYERFLEIVYPSSVEKRSAARQDKKPADHPDCELSTRKAFLTYGKFDAGSAFALQFHRFVVNVCADADVNVDLAQAAMLACTTASTISV